jgi:hypothetical protein
VCVLINAYIKPLALVFRILRVKTFGFIKPSALVFKEGLRNRRRYGKTEGEGKEGRRYGRMGEGKEGGRVELSYEAKNKGEKLRCLLLHRKKIFFILRICIDNDC